MTIQEAPIVAQLQGELARIGFPVPTTALRALVGSERGEALPAERLGRVLGYERERFLAHRGAPRIVVAITPDAKPMRPQHLADGDWRLSRRIITKDALPGQAAALGVRLCQRAEEAPHARALLWPHVQEAAQTAFGWTSVGDADWADLYPKFLRAQPHSIGSPTAEQSDAEKALNAQQVSGLVNFFGSDEAVVTATALSTLRAPAPGEHGEALDDLVRTRAGSPEIAREVLAFIQEWGHVADELRRAGIDRTATIEDYIQRWNVSDGEAANRLSLFRQIFPNENDPGALWRLLWDMVPSSDATHAPAFVRLISQPVIAGGEMPTLAAYFLTCLYDQLTRPDGAQVHSAGLQPQDEQQNPRRDLERLYWLAQRATETWAVRALETEGGVAGQSLRGRTMLAPLQVDATAPIVAEQAVGAYRQAATNRGTRAVLLGAQKCLRVCAGLSLHDPPSAITPILPGARHAASSLAALCAMGACNPVEEVGATMDVLYKR
jgi:hypothetical protein